MRVGIFGGGQLGQMLAQAAERLDIESLVLDPKPDAVAGQVARHLVADYEDSDALEEMAGCDAVTYEFENVPAASLGRLMARVLVHPSPASLEISGDRVREKELFRELGIATAPFAAVGSRADLDSAVAEIGLPAILKTRRFGYDGKGQAVVREPLDVDEAWARLGGQDLVLEGFVPFDREVSVLAVRGRDGATRYWPPTENLHVDGILHISRAPARDVPEPLFDSARRGIEALMARLDYVGVLVVEFFQVGAKLVANEMACRVHNSGHWTIEGAQTSQFENHMRAVAGMSLGAVDAPHPCAMINLVSEIPDASVLEELERDPSIHVHVYGKTPAPGRKLGHVTLAAATPDDLEAKLARVLGRIGDRAAS